MHGTRRRHAAAVLLALAVLLACPIGAALAHDAWVQPYAPIVRVGQPAYVDLMLGNHSHEHRSYRLAGKLDPRRVRLEVIAPDGRAQSLQDALFDTGESDDTPPPGPKGYLSAAFVPQAEGIYVVAARGDAVLQHGNEPSFRSLRLNKTVIAAAANPVAEAVRSFRGFDRAVGDDRLEIVPEVNPSALFPGDEVALALRLKGRPLAGQTVSVIRRSTGEFQDLTTDAQGRVRFAAGDPDYYLVRVKLDRPEEREAGRYEKTTYEATFTFVVQARPQGEAAAGGRPPGGGTPDWAWFLGGGVLGAVLTALATAALRRRPAGP